MSEPTKKKSTTATAPLAHAALAAAAARALSSDSEGRAALEDDFDRGIKNRRAVLGDAGVDKSLDNATEFRSSSSKRSLLLPRVYNPRYARCTAGSSISCLAGPLCTTWPVSST